MTTNRDRRGARRRTPQTDPQDQLDRRRAQVLAAEGHAGSVPRGNQPPEDETLGSHREQLERVLGH